MRKYLVLFNHNSKFFNNYAEIDATNKDDAYFSALRVYGNFTVATVMPANTRSYNWVALFGKTKLQT